LSEEKKRFVEKIVERGKKKKNQIKEASSNLAEGGQWIAAAGGKLWRE
jgi:ferritin-like metal-binding protein YciE